MPSLPFFLAPAALLLPFGWLAVPEAGAEVEAPVARQVSEGDGSLTALPLSDKAPAWDQVFDGISPSEHKQVRIERRVILRISPAPGPARQNLTAETTRTPVRTRIVERPAGKCLDSAAIGGVTDRGDQLLIFLRDRRTIAARLEKGCSPRDFYRGFYMERSDDGRLCVNRDRIMSRAGAKCQIKRFSELVVEPVE